VYLARLDNEIDAFEDFVSTDFDVQVLEFQ
jgi:hypothetical protein